MEPCNTKPDQVSGENCFMTTVGRHFSVDLRTPLVIQMPVNVIRCVGLTRELYRYGMSNK